MLNPLEQLHPTEHAEADHKTVELSPDLKKVIELLLAASQETIHDKLEIPAQARLAAIQRLGGNLETAQQVVEQNLTAAQALQTELKEDLNPQTKAVWSSEATLPAVLEAANQPRPTVSPIIDGVKPPEQKEAEEPLAA